MIHGGARAELLGCSAMMARRTAGRRPWLELGLRLWLWLLVAAACWDLGLAGGDMEMDVGVCGGREETTVKGKGAAMEIPLVDVGSRQFQELRVQYGGAKTEGIKRLNGEEIAIFA